MTCCDKESELIFKGKLYNTYHCNVCEFDIYEFLPSVSRVKAAEEATKKYWSDHDKGLRERIGV